MAAYIAEGTALSDSILSFEAPRTVGYLPNASTRLLASIIGTLYRMRAYDTTLATVVYWNSTVPDTTQYVGPGPLTNVAFT